MPSFRLTPRQKRFVLALAVFGLLGALVTWRLPSLPAGISASENSLIATITRFGWLSPGMIEHFLYYAPIKLIVTTQTEHTVLLLRLANAFYALAGLGIYYLLARNWWSQTVALAGTILFATSAWFLVATRVIDPGMLAMMWLPLLLLIFLKLKHESKWWQVVTAGFVSGLAFYVSPVLAWLSIALIITALHYSIRLNRGRVVNGWLIFFIGFLVALIPLLSSIIREPSFVLQVLGIQQLNTPADMLLRAKALGSALLYDASDTKAFVNRLPLLDITTITLALYGFLRALMTAKLGRSTPVLFVLMVSLLITILTRAPTGLYAYLLPIVFLFVARGLNQLMSEWYQRFPRNPGARLVGAVALILLVGLASLYNVRVFYVAWTRNLETRAYFSTQL